jgi:hypothetical protein
MNQGHQIVVAVDRQDVKHGPREATPGGILARHTAPPKLRSEQQSGRTRLANKYGPPEAFKPCGMSLRPSARETDGLKI